MTFGGAFGGGPITTGQWTYGYDAAWNLTNRINGTTVEAFTVNALNQLTAIPDSTPAYDRRGNLTAGTFSGNQQWLYSYDAENRLTSVATDTTANSGAGCGTHEFFCDQVHRGQIRVVDAAAPAVAAAAPCCCHDVCNLTVGLQAGSADRCAAAGEPAALFNSPPAGLRGPDST